MIKLIYCFPFAAFKVTEYKGTEAVKAVAVGEAVIAATRNGGVARVSW